MEKLEKELLECLEAIQQISTDAKNQTHIRVTRIHLNSIEYWQKRAMKILDKIEFGGVK